MTTIYKVQRFSRDEDFNKECNKKRDQFITGNR